MVVVVRVDADVATISAYPTQFFRLLCICYLIRMDRYPMKTFKQVERIVSEVDRITCNKCGQEANGSGGLLYATVNGGYTSTHIEDGSSYEFDLCEACVVELMKTFKHSAFQSCICGGEHHICQTK